MGGVGLFGQWIREYRRAATEEEQQLLHTVLYCLNLLSVSMELIEQTKIGRSVSALAQCSNSEVASEAEALVTKWKATLSSEPGKRPKLDEFTKANPALPCRAPAIRWAEESLVAVKYFMKNDEPNAECATQRPMPEFLEEAFEQMTTEDFRKKEAMIEFANNRKASSEKTERHVREAIDNLTPKVHYSTLIGQRIPKSLRSQPDSLERSEFNKLLHRTKMVVYERESEVPKGPQDKSVGEIGCIPQIPLGRLGTAVKMLEMAPSFPQVMLGFMPYIMPDAMYKTKPKVQFDPLTKKPTNYRTLPCLKYHSSEGCIRGDNCHFIHDFEFAGKPIPNFREWKMNRGGRASYFPPNP
jgi:hypothetical protein